MILTQVVFQETPNGDIMIDIESSQLHKTERELGRWEIFQKHLKAAMEEAVSTSPKGGAWAEGKGAHDIVNRVFKKQ